MAARTAADPAGGAREVALRLLAARARSRRELEQRLAMRGFPREVVGPVLDRLAEVQLLDDAAFAGAYAERRAARGLSAAAVAQELRSRGVGGDVAEQAAAAASPPADAGDRARELAEAYLSRLGGLPDATRARRLTGYLARRGYRGEVVAEVVAGVLGEAG